MTKDYYEVLGVDKNATEKDVAKAYRSLVAKVHPDLNPDEESVKKFKEVQEAYDVLGNAANRSNYDRQFLHGIRFQQRSPDDISNIFEGLFNQTVVRGIRYRMSVTLEEAFSGITKIIKISGKDVEVVIPPGVEQGMQIRIPNGSDSDLYVVIEISKHPNYELRGNNLYTKVPVPYTIMALGGTIEVETLSDTIEAKIRAGTQNGSRLKLSEQGMLNMHGKRGDLYVLLDVIVPKKLNKEEKNLLTKLLQLEKEHDERTQRSSE